MTKNGCILKATTVYYYSGCGGNILSVRGFRINITERLTPSQVQFFAQWIGAANVMRNQKIGEFKSLIAANAEFPVFSQGYAGIKAKEELFFLRDVPVQILRNVATEAYQDTQKTNWLNSLA